MPKMLVHKLPKAYMITNNTWIAAKYINENCM